MSKIPEVSTSPFRHFNELMPEEQEQVQSKLASLDSKDPISVLQFGIMNNAEIAMLSDTTTDYQNIQDLFIKLKEQMLSMDFLNLFKNPKRFPFLKDNRKQICKVLANQLSTEKVLEGIEDALIRTKLNLMEDLSLCRTLHESTQVSLKQQELNFIAVAEALYAEEQELEKVKSNPHFDGSEIQAAIERLQRKLHAISLTHITTKQYLAQITLVQDSNEKMLEKLEESLYTILPLWKRQYSLAMLLYRMRNATIIAKIMKDSTNELLQANSEFLKQTLCAAGEEIDNSSIDIVALKKISQDLGEIFQNLAQKGDETKRQQNKALITLKNLQKVTNL